MVKQFGIKIEGIPKAMTFLNTKAILAMKKADEGIKEAGFFIEGEVKQSIAGHRPETRSVDTGRFLNSVTTNFSKLQAKIFSSVNYAQFLEFGTSRVQPRHHFRNTKERNKSKVAEFVQAKVNTI